MGCRKWKQGREVTVAYMRFPLKVLQASWPNVTWGVNKSGVFFCGRFISLLWVSLQMMLVNKLQIRGIAIRLPTNQTSLELWWQRNNMLPERALPKSQLHILEVSKKQSCMWRSYQLYLSLFLELFTWLFLWWPHWVELPILLSSCGHTHTSRQFKLLT